MRCNASQEGGSVRAFGLRITLARSTGGVGAVSHGKAIAFRKRGIEVGEGGKKWGCGPGEGPYSENQALLENLDEFSITSKLMVIRGGFPELPGSQRIAIKKQDMVDGKFSGHLCM